MDPETTAEILTQHTQLLSLMQQVITILTVLVFVWILFMGVMAVLAAWSVSRVNRRQVELEVTWKQLLELLLHNLTEHGAEKR